MTGTSSTEAWPGVVVKLLSASPRIKPHAGGRGDGTANRMWSVPGRAFISLRSRVLALAAVGASMLAVGAVSAVAPAVASAAAWRAQPVPSPVAPNGQLAAVSCASSTACTVVGWYINGSGTAIALGERWNGTSWSIQTTKDPAGASSTVLSGVSCASSTACTAVGSYNNSTFAESWNGTGWSIQATPNPTGASTSQLSGVSCTSSTACTAVGDYSTSGSGTTLMLAERWNGTRWSIQATPNPTGTSSSQLAGVSCTSTTACTAVGVYNTSSATGGTLAERWNGTSWSIQATPNPTGASGSLEGVSCASSTACTAVGFYFSNSALTEVTLAERWNGTSWSIQATPNPTGNAESNLDGVSCASSTDCTAVGHFDTNTSEGTTLAERWNGTSWSIEATPNPTGAYASNLGGVSCTSSSACTAVGPYYTTSSSGATVTSGTLAETWNGTSWSIQATANPLGAAASYLDGVSCASSTACTAVGYYTNSSGTDVTLAERWDGTSWSIQATSNPTGAFASYLGGVSCTSSTACTAVGSYNNSTLAERWNGTSWSIQATPNPTGTSSSSLNAVSCASSTACTAVGYYTGSSGTYGTLAERWNGTSWSIQATPNPTGTPTSALEGVSCTSTTACTAVGFDTGSSGANGTLAERWNGTSWSIQATPNPAGGRASYLDGVSCTSSTACTAVGSYTNSSGDVTLAERWNGTNWSIQTTADVTSYDNYLGSVSCASSNACTAVGYYTNNGVQSASMLAENWNGTSWSIQATANPASAYASFLDAVSCTSSVACTAVGSYDSAISLTLAERYS